MTDQIDKKTLIRGAKALSVVLSRAVAEAEDELDRSPLATKTSLFRPKAAFLAPVRAKTILAADRALEVDFIQVGDVLRVTVYSVGPAAVRQHQNRNAELRSRNGAVWRRFKFDAFGRGELEFEAQRANDALAEGFDIEVARKWEAAK